MKKLVCATIALGLLSACSAQKHSEVQKTLADKRPQIITAANTALAALEATTHTYNAQHPIPPAILTSLQQADVRAHGDIAMLSSAPPADIGTIAQRIAQEMAAIASSLPPGVLPPAAQASIVTFSTLASILVPIVAADVAANPPAQPAGEPAILPAPSREAVPVPNAPIAPMALAAPPAAVAPTPSFEPAHAPVHAGAPHH